MPTLEYVTTVSQHMASSCRHHRAEEVRPHELGHHESVVIFGDQQHLFWELISHFVEFC